MKIIDTVVLIGYIDPFDIRNEKATQYINQVQEDDLMLASAVLMELDLELKTHSVSNKDRALIFTALNKVIPSEKILSLNTEIFAKAGRLADKAKWRGAYFDTLIAATALIYDIREIITTDRKFEKFGLKYSF